MGRKQIFKKCSRVGILLEEEQLEQIKRHAISQSRAEGRLINVSEMIRRALSTCYPVGSRKEMELFGG